MIIKYISELTKTISSIVRGDVENNDIIGKRGDHILLAANGGAEDYGFGSTGSEVTSTTPVALSSNAAYEVMISNTTGFDIRISRSDGSGGFLVLRDGFSLPLDIIKDTNEVSVARNSGSGAIDIQFYWKR